MTTTTLRIADLRGRCCVRIERQARKWFADPIVSLIPVSVGTPARGLVTSTQASYANFIWGIPDQLDSEYPMFGTSSAVGQGDAARRVIIVQEGSPAAKAGINVGDVMQSFDGVALTDKETFNRLMIFQNWI